MRSGWIGHGERNDEAVLSSNHAPLFGEGTRQAGHRRRRQLKRFTFLIAGWRSGLTKLLSIAVKTLPSLQTSYLK